MSYSRKHFIIVLALMIPLILAMPTFAAWPTASQWIPTLGANWSYVTDPVNDETQKGIWTWCPI